MRRLMLAFALSETLLHHALALLLASTATGHTTRENEISFACLLTRMIRTYPVVTAGATLVVVVLCVELEGIEVVVGGV